MALRATAPIEPLAEYPSCVVCGSGKLSELAGPDRMAMEAVQACEECGTLSRDPQLTTRGAFESYAQDAYHPRWMETSYRE